MIRFYNGRIMTMQNGVELTEGELWTENDKISYIGPYTAPMPIFEREINLNGNIIMPGFKNAHTHSAMTFLRSAADDLPLQDWLEKQVFPREAKLNVESVYAFTKLAILEYLSSGITACFDMYFYNDGFVRAMTECGFRAVMCDSMNNFDSDYTNVEKNFLHYNNVHPLISYHLGFHAEYTTCMERMEYVASLAQKYKAPVYTHLAETKNEVEGCISRYGKTPAALLDSLGMFNYGGGGYHCVYMTDEDLDIFARHGVCAITNPSSNAKLASGIAPLCRMQEKGVSLAIGTDGPASNNALDMFREMYLCAVLQKLKNDDAAAFPAASALEMATVGGARAMGLNDCDVLSVGKQADLIVIDLHRPNMQPIHNIPKNIVYSGSKENVRLTMVAGKILYENGIFHVGESAEDIYSRAQKLTDQIMNS